MNFKVVIIDDEPKAIDLIRHYVNQTDALTIAATFRDPFKAFHYLSTSEVDLVFLDINMPQLSGLDLLSNLKNKPNVIFTTAYAEYAINGFDLDAVDYLLKPISFSRFSTAIQKFLKRHNTPTVIDEIPSDPVYIKSGTKNYKFFWRDIILLEKSENYVIYHLMDGQRLLSRTTLGEVEKLFPSYMIRVHKSYAVGLHHIITVEANKIQVPDLEVPIGRKFKEIFHERYDRHKALTVKK